MACRTRARPGGRGEAVGGVVDGAGEGGVERRGSLSGGEGGRGREVESGVWGFDVERKGSGGKGDASGSEDVSTSDPPFLLLHAALYDRTGTIGREMVENVNASGGPGTSDAAVHTLIGTTVATGQCLMDEFGVKRCLFLFPDLSVRLPGEWRLRFSLVDVEGR
ncbi:hypothetical protein HDV00_009536 [Rhizophlyctis rosea]|nr:hypothetical protein HDV00_009536 [Rhizophlyctis rosea]